MNIIPKKYPPISVEFQNLQKSQDNIDFIKRGKANKAVNEGVNSFS